MTAHPEQNLALISREYLHLSLRLGYHFNVVDTYLTDVPNDNYVYFRFLGGVTEMARRSRRAILLRRILERFGFVVEGPSAGGHNAPPRGPRRTDDRGEPVYDERDTPDLDRIAGLGLPQRLRARC